MSLMPENEPLEVVPLDVPLDPATIAWLARLVRATGDPPAEIVASMLRMIRIDDQAAHAEDQTKH
jgi:hypothetical protein